jgi:phosphoserine aminotransferase
MLDWNGSVSVMEVSHRGKEFMALQAGIEADLRELLAIPANYKVLFLQGGAIGQNAIVPMNLLRGKRSADYVNTGAWSVRSIAEAAHYCRVNVAASGERGGFTAIPKQSEWRLDCGLRAHLRQRDHRRRRFHWVPTPATCPWWRTCRRTSCRGRSTSRDTA